MKSELGRKVMNISDPYGSPKGKRPLTGARKLKRTVNINDCKTKKKQRKPEPPKENTSRIDNHFQ